MDIENNFWHTIHKNRLKKYYAQFSILNKLKESSGLFIELGVFKATSLIRIASYLEFQFEKTPILYGFDTFDEFPIGESPTEDDISFLKDFLVAAGRGLSIAEIEKICIENEINNISLVKGDINKTFPKFLKEKNQSISFLHVDVDLYSVTRNALFNALPFLQKGSILMFDDYEKVNSSTTAINEFISETGFEIKVPNGCTQPYFTIV